MTGTPSRRQLDIMENDCGIYGDTNHLRGNELDQAEILPPHQNEIGICIAADLRRSSSWRFVLCQLLSGMTVAVHQIPECVAYALIAGVDPFHALQAAWIANIFTPLLGGAPGLVSGPSGLGAIAIRFLVSTRGPEYIFYSVILCGFCQVLFGALRFGKYLRLLPTGITIGMVNGLCVLLMALQLRYFKLYPAMQASYTDSSTNSTSIAEVEDNYFEPTRYLETTTFTSNITEDALNQPWAYFLGYDLPWDTSKSQVIIVSVEAIVAMLICHYFPKFIAIVPSSFLAILFLTSVNSIIPAGSAWVAPTVGDYFVWEVSSFFDCYWNDRIRYILTHPNSLTLNCTQPPTSKFFMGMFHSDYTIPPFNLETFFAVVPTGLSLFCIGLLESLVAINIVDMYTSVVSEQDHVFYGQGVGNLVSGIMLGMGGTGLAHSSLLGLQMGGITHLCVFSSGIAMLCSITFAYPAVAVIPLGALMGVAMHLILTMMQTPPVLSLMFKCTLVKRLVASDIFSTFVTAMFVILASTYGLAGYFIGVVCYACDPIAHGK